MDVTLLHFKEFSETRRKGVEPNALCMKWEILFCFSTRFERKSEEFEAPVPKKRRMKYELPCLDGKPKLGFGNCCKVSIDSTRVFLLLCFATFSQVEIRYMCKVPRPSTWTCISYLWTTVSAQWGPECQRPRIFVWGGGSKWAVEFCGQIQNFHVGFVGGLKIFRLGSEVGLKFTYGFEKQTLVWRRDRVEE